MPDNVLKSVLERHEFACTAELVLGRDHVVAEAETFIRDAAGSQSGVRIVSVTDLPGGNPALPPEAWFSCLCS